MRKILNYSSKISKSDIRNFTIVPAVLISILPAINMRISDAQTRNTWRAPVLSSSLRFPYFISIIAREQNKMQFPIFIIDTNSISNLRSCINFAYALISPVTIILLSRYRRTSAPITDIMGRLWADLCTLFTRLPHG